MLILRPEELTALHDATVTRFGGLKADINAHGSAQKISWSEWSDSDGHVLPQML